MKPVSFRRDFEAKGLGSWNYKTRTTKRPVDQEGLRETQKNSGLGVDWILLQKMQIIPPYMN